MSFIEYTRLAHINDDETMDFLVNKALLSKHMQSGLPSLGATLTKCISTLNMPKKYFYAVQNGRCKGVYFDWASCKEQVDHYNGARYRKFESMEEAVAFASPDRQTTIDIPIPPHVNMYDESRSSSSKDVPRFFTPNAKPPPKPSSSNVSTQKDRPGKTIVYTDGASSSNGQVNARAGYGVYWGEGDPRNVSEPLRGERQTNQRAEATAVYRALQQAKHLPGTMEIHTDSRYVIGAMTQWSKKWIKNDWTSTTGKEVQNRDLFEKILKAQKERKGETQFVYVPGHSGVHGNERADELAVRGAAQHYDD